MVDVNIFEYFNMPDESIQVGAAGDGYKNSKRIWSYTIYFHCISIKRYSRRYLLSNIWLLHAGFCPLKPSSQRLQRFHSVFFFIFGFPLSLSVYSQFQPHTLNWHTRSLSRLLNSFDKTKDLHCDFKIAQRVPNKGNQMEQKIMKTNGTGFTFSSMENRMSLKNTSQEAQKCFAEKCQRSSS